MTVPRRRRPVFGAEPLAGRGLISSKACRQCRDDLRRARSRRWGDQHHAGPRPDGAYIGTDSRFSLRAVSSPEGDPDAATSNGSANRSASGSGADASAANSRLWSDRFSWRAVTTSGSAAFDFSAHAVSERSHRIGTISHTDAYFGPPFPRTTRSVRYSWSGADGHSSNGRA